jgi:glycosyltransferase involved in cell wall biosynthesis
MINPLSVLILTPSKDGKVETTREGSMISIASAHLFGNIAYLNECSNIGMARNLMIAGALHSQYEWFVFLDDDISFVPRDFKILMDYPQTTGGDDVLPPIDLTPEIGYGPTKIGVKNLQGDIEHHVMISCAEYSKKTDSGDVARLGLGFCKIHRSVFSALDALDSENEGEAFLDSFMNQGRLVTDYFITGCRNHNFLTEDVGFFTLCRMAGIYPRIEQRCQLIHTGKKQYHYTPVDMGTVQ